MCQVRSGDLRRRVSHMTSLYRYVKLQKNMQNVYVVVVNPVGVTSTAKITVSLVYAYINDQGLHLLTLNLIPVWISNYIHYKVWDEIT